MGVKPEYKAQDEWSKTDDAKAILACDDIERVMLFAFLAGFEAGKREAVARVVRRVRETIS